MKQEMKRCTTYLKSILKLEKIIVNDLKEFDELIPEQQKAIKCLSNKISKICKYINNELKNILENKMSKIQTKQIIKLYMSGKSIPHLVKLGYKFYRIRSILKGKIRSLKDAGENRRLPDEVFFDRTKKLCSDRGIKMIEFHRGRGNKSKFYQEGYGEFFANPSHVWNGSNHPLKTQEDSPKGNNFLVKNKNGIQKRVIANLKKFGYDSQHPDILKKIQEKQKKTMLQRYGVEYAMQNEESLNRAFEKQHKNSKYESIRFGTLIYQCSYELEYLKLLEKDFDVIAIKRGPRISFIHPEDNKTHYYFIDFLVTRRDLVKEIVEIKSTYIFGDDSNKYQQAKQQLSLAKLKASKEYAKEKGFKCIWIVKDKNANIVTY